MYLSGNLYLFGFSLQKLQIGAGGNISTGKGIACEALSSSPRTNPIPSLPKNKNRKNCKSSLLGIIMKNRIIRIRHKVKWVVKKVEFLQ
jgi:hypothetical protein